jgi:hypothetical protein
MICGPSICFVPVSAGMFCGASAREELIVHSGSDRTKMVAIMKASFLVIFIGPYENRVVRRQESDTREKLE